jgi:hypothetical protein
VHATPSVPAQGTGVSPSHSDKKHAGRWGLHDKLFALHTSGLEQQLPGGATALQVDVGLARLLKGVLLLL